MEYVMYVLMFLGGMLADRGVIALIDKFRKIV